MNVSKKDTCVDEKRPIRQHLYSRRGDGSCQVREIWICQKKTYVCEKRLIIETY